jgi:hypothetical protein
MDERIEEKIDMNERQFDYKNHRIWLHSYELKAGGWVPRAVVVLPSEDGDGQQELLYPSEGTFPMREDADRQAFEMGKQWIDQRLAGDL